MCGGRELSRSGRIATVILTIGMIAGLGVPAEAMISLDLRGASDVDDIRIRALAQRQLDELGIPREFLPFLRDDANNDAKVRTGRELWGEPGPDLAGSSSRDVIETDLRYSYEVDGGQQPLGFAEADIDTRITVRTGTNGKKLWTKRYDRDAWPISMRVGPDGRAGIVVISGIWNFYGTTEEHNLRFDAFDGRRGKHLWTRNYTSVTSYELLTYVAKDAPLVIAPFDGLEGRATDLLIALATVVSAPTGGQTMATRVVVIDGATGQEHAHPQVDVGIEWWPIPLPTNDLDEDGLDDYATTNNIGFDPGGSQEPPSAGGTVYARKGTNGSSIWTTSGIEMALFGFTNKLPDVVASSTPDVGLTTYVQRRAVPVVPISLPLLDGWYYKPRIYLFEGAFGAEAWHKAWEWIYSPGDIATNGKNDLMLGKYRAQFRKGKTTLHLLAIDGEGNRLWQRRSVWKFETMECPRGLCFGGYGWWLDVSPDFEPDRVRDILFGQIVQQNAAFEDKITRVYSGRTGRLRWQDEDQDLLQSAGVAIDGRGTDLVGYEYRKSKNKLRVTARDGSNEILWSGLLGGPDKLLPRNSWFYAMGFELPGDRCGDLVLTGFEERDSFYAVFDGGSGRIMWWRWTGPRSDHPTFTQRKDQNRVC